MTKAEVFRLFTSKAFREKALVRPELVVWALHAKPGDLLPFGSDEERDGVFAYFHGQETIEAPDFRSQLSRSFAKIGWTW